LPTCKCFTNRYATRGFYHFTRLHGSGQSGDSFHAAFAGMKKHDTGCVLRAVREVHVLSELHVQERVPCIEAVGMANELHQTAAGRTDRYLAEQWRRGCEEHFHVCHTAIDAQGVDYLAVEFQQCG